VWSGGKKKTINGNGATPNGENKRPDSVAKSEAKLAMAQRVC
jgi:hypothetical protein